METPIAPRTSMTIPMSMGMAAMTAKGAGDGVGAPGKGAAGDGIVALTTMITIPIAMKKKPPIISDIGLVPIIAFWVPGGGVTETTGIGEGIRAKPQVWQNWAPGTII